MIELTNEVSETKKYFKLKLFLFFFSSALFAVFGLRAWTYALVLYEQTKAKVIESLTRVQIIREVLPENELSLDEVITQVSKEKHLNPVILRAIALKESSLGKNVYRFEPKVYDRLKTVTNDSERRMLASSHGAFQVMGFNSESRCGMHWSRLYDNRLGALCSIKILKDNLEDHKHIKNPAMRLREALRAYNGSGEAAEAYADSVMARIAELMLTNLGDI